MAVFVSEMIKMELPISSGTSTVRTVLVTELDHGVDIQPIYNITELDNSGATVWSGNPTHDVAKAFQQALDRAAYGLRVQNRRK